MTTPTQRRWFAAIWIGGWCALGIAALVLLRGWRQQAGVATTRSQESWGTLRDGDPHPHYDPARFVWDSACFLRPRADVVTELRIGPIGGGAEIAYELRHVQWGIVRPESLPDPITSPVVLLVGDSHLYGFCDVRDNAATIIERLLRDRGWPDAIVANGSSPYYSLHQIAERMRTLGAHVDPRVCIAVIFVGNDFIELEDVSRPHLDDALAPQPANPNPPPETTSARRLLYNRCRPRLFGELFWQGINQAIYLHERPERYPVVLAKARRCAESMAASCRALDARLIVALIPSYDDWVDFKLPFADDAAMGPILAEQSNRRLRVDFKAELERLGVMVVDVWPVFHGSTEPDLYAGDFHIWRNAHRLIAEALAPVVVAELTSPVGPSGD